MKLSINAETSISFEIEMDGKEVILRQDGGTWYLVRGPHEWQNIAGPRVEWPEALKRALVELSQ